MWLEMVWGSETKKKENGVLKIYPQLGRFGGPLAPPGSAWQPNKLFLLVGKPWP
jgi:hypothetical protein